MRANHKPCPKCGGEMHRQSKMCVACYEAERARPDNYVAKTCPVCGKEFTVHKGQIEHGYGLYCSRSCARSGNPTRKRTAPSVTCHVCGVEFRKYDAEIRKTVGGLHFCSPACWYEHNQRENHYGWEGGQHERMNPEGTAWRKAVLERDHYYCRLCHSRRNLEVHHIKRFGTYPELRWSVDNGVTLCHDCHVKFRHREEEYEDVFELIASVPVEVWHV